MEIKGFDMPNQDDFEAIGENPELSQAQIDALRPKLVQHRSGIKRCSKCGYSIQEENVCSHCGAEFKQASK